MPDMAQTLAVVALFAEGATTIRNVGNLRVKETDRMVALQTELTKLGATVTIDGDDITITPPSDGKLKPAMIKTYDDHRMAMSFAIAGLRGCGVPGGPGITIDDPGCVTKTFPDFFDYLERLRR
jgi:3-phosphoshikimate 1-carboxyvinyltransferase